MKLSLPIRIFLICIALTTPILAQKPTPTPERDRAIVGLLNDARLAAPELAVDTFLKVVESKKVKDPGWRREILDDALRITEDIKNPFQLTVSPTKGVDIRFVEAGLVSAAHSQKLDRLSLKSRIIRQYLALDAEAAKQIVFGISGQLGIKPRTCEDLLVYDVREIYRVVEAVAKEVFDEKQVADGVRGIFIVPWIENIESPVQVPFVLHLLEAMKSPPAERRILVNAFATAIDRDFGDDRSFMIAAVGFPGSRVVEIPKGDEIGAAEIRRAYRGFLLKNIRGSRCAENVLKQNDPIPPYVSFLNSLTTGQILSFEELSPFSVKGKAQVRDVLSKSEDLKNFRKELLSISAAGSPETPYEFDRTNLEWQSKVVSFVNKIADWKPREELSDIELFSIRSSFHLALIQTIADGDLRKFVARAWLRFLAGSAMQRTSYIQWSKEIWSFNAMVGEKNTLFGEIAAEFPNPNLRVIVAAKKLSAQVDRRIKSDEVSVKIQPRERP